MKTQSSARRCVVVSAPDAGERFEAAARRAIGRTARFPTKKVARTSMCSQISMICNLFTQVATSMKMATSIPRAGRQLAMYMAPWFPNWYRTRNRKFIATMRFRKDGSLKSVGALMYYE